MLAILVTTSKTSSSEFVQAISSGKQNKVNNNKIVFGITANPSNQRASKSIIHYNDIANQSNSARNIHIAKFYGLKSIQTSRN